MGRDISEGLKSGKSVKYKKIILIVLTIVLFKGLNAQNQHAADSLKKVLTEQNSFSDSLIITTLFKITLASSSPDEIQQYADELIDLAKKNESIQYEIHGYMSKGIAHRLSGNIEQSLKYLFLAATTATDNDEKALLAESYIEIAATYTTNDNLKAAVSFERKGIDIMRMYARDEQLAISLLNIGYSYYSLANYDSALSYYQEAEPLFDSIDLKIGKAYLKGNEALVYWKQGYTDKAEKGLLEAIEMLNPLGDDYGMADYHNQLGRVFFENKQIQKSITHTEKALALGLSLGLKEQIRDATELLAKVYEQIGNYEKAFQYQSEYISYKDSIENSEQIRKIADMRTKFEVDLRETEIDLLEKKQRLNQIYILVAIILLFLAIVLILFFLQRSKSAQLLTLNERKLHANSVRDLLKSQENKALESMVQGRDNERRRLAQELHNHFGSLLATIKVNINAIDEDEIPNHGTLSTLVDQACNDMRSISHSLNMGISENFGLVPALKELVTHLQDAGHLKVEFQASMCEGVLTSENEIIIYRIVQELVSNVLKHAEATKITILLTCYEDEGLINIIVNDNGKGFDVSEVKKKQNGIGLNSLTSLTEKHEGEINFDSHTASGTTITIDLPITIDTKLL